MAQTRSANLEAEQEGGEERGDDKEDRGGGGGIVLEQLLESRKSVASANLEINRGKSVERDVERKVE